MPRRSGATILMNQEFIALQVMEHVELQLV
jgi:hypothetical protein